MKKKVVLIEDALAVKVRFDQFGMGSIKQNVLVNGDPDASEEYLLVPKNKVLALEAMKFCGTHMQMVMPDWEPWNPKDDDCVFIDYAPTVWGFEDGE